MKYRKVTAILRYSFLEKVEQSLVSIGIDDISVTQVHGYGEYRNFYQADTMCEHARVEIYCLASQAKDIANCIMEKAHTGQAGDGVVAISPVEELLHTRTKTSIS